VLSFAEAEETTTWHDEPSYHALSPVSMMLTEGGSSPTGLFASMLSSRWQTLLDALDGDDDGYLYARTVFPSHLYIKAIFLPRQAQDKHRERETQKRRLPFS
jgi:hypothetical protein